MKNTEPLEEYFSLLAHYIHYEKKIAIGVSWWPDSMFLAHVVLAYYEKMWRKKEKIHIIHCNHGQREASSEEQSFVLQSFPECYIYWNTTLPAAWLGETQLRTFRHSIFETTLLQEWIDIILLGHNLTDRIETSLLNMVRGATNGWRNWMNPLQKHKNYTIIRPLILLSKTHIQEACDKHWISYRVDPTNYQKNNPRNILRNHIILEICSLHPWWATQREKSWANLYESFSQSELQTGEKNHRENQRHHHTPHHSWAVSSRQTISCHLLLPVHLWSLLWGGSQKKTEDVMSLWHAICSGKIIHHHAWWRHFFVVGWILHCLQSPETIFWNQVKTQKPITRSGVLQFDSNIYTIVSEWVWCTLRYPLAWDVYKKKPLTKTLTNRKIPVFLRSTTPVIALGKSIVAILS
jgi:tRNA(Ile)-lysidine synthetase-like protein